MYGLEDVSFQPVPPHLPPRLPPLQQTQKYYPYAKEAQLRKMASIGSFQQALSIENMIALSCAKRAPSPH